MLQLWAERERNHALDRSQVLCLELKDPLNVVAEKPVLPDGPGGQRGKGKVPLMDVQKILCRLLPVIPVGH